MTDSVPRRFAVKPLWLLAAIAAVPAVHAVALLGRIHPDEVYQALEPAFFKANGYGILAWEWQQGIRNWAVPGFLALLLKACFAVGLDNPRVYRAVLELPQYGLHLASLCAVYRYARRRLPEQSGELWPLIAASLVGLHGLVILFAGRTMSESISASFMLLGAEAIDRAFFPNEDARKAGLLGGLYLGLAVVARYGSAVVVIALVLYLLAGRKWKALAFTVLSGALVAGALGLLDWATWKEPFHSLKAYLQFNVLSGQAARQFGAADWQFYVPWFFRETPFWVWLGLPFALWKERPRISAPLVGAALYLAAICYTEHKEERFLYPGLVLLSMAGASGLVGVLARINVRELKAAIAALALCAGFAPLFYTDWPELRADQLRAITWATRGDATGLLVVNEGVWGAGGYFYIGKNIPWGVCDFGNEPRFIGAMRDPRINRAVTFEDRAVDELQRFGFKEIHRIGRERIFAR